MTQVLYIVSSFPRPLLNSRGLSKKVLNFLLFLFSALLLAGCSTVPYTGRSQLMLVSQGEEIEMGNQAWQEVMHSEKPCPDMQANMSLQRVGFNIAAVTGRTDYAWEFMVFQSKDVNAFCLPGGKVGVYFPLFRLADNDAELATVVGHEIAHAIARHSAERTSQDMLNQLGLNAVGIATGSSVYSEIFGIATKNGVILPYSRLHEYEADYIGLLLMANAGYDPAAALVFWQKFKNVTQSSPLFGDFFSTHPMSEKRIEQFKEKLPEAIAIYMKAPNKLGLGARYR